jgi:hypothetical protein
VEGRVSQNAGILLANLLQSSRSTFPCVSFPSFFAFNEGTWNIPISALGGSPTVSAGFLRLIDEPVVVEHYVMWRCDLLYL